jgi:hypothetical protein
MLSGSRKPYNTRADSPAFIDHKDRPSPEFIAICKQLNIGNDLMHKTWRQYDDTNGQQGVVEVLF